LLSEESKLLIPSKKVLARIVHRASFLIEGSGLKYSSVFGREDES
jgi:hypothetical protein